MIVLITRLRVHHSRLGLCESRKRDVAYVTSTANGVTGPFHGGGMHCCGRNFSRIGCHPIRSFDIISDIIFDIILQWKYKKYLWEIMTRCNAIATHYSIQNVTIFIVIILNSQFCTH